MEAKHLKPKQNLVNKNSLRKKCKSNFSYKRHIFEFIVLEVNIDDLLIH